MQSDTGGRYAEVPSGDSFVNCSALGETSGPGSIAGSHAFIYVNGAGLYANHAQVRWRGVFNLKTPWKFVKLHHFPTIYFPGRYISLNLNTDTIKANTDVCGRYTKNGETSPWVYEYETIGRTKVSFGVIELIPLVILLAIVGIVFLISRRNKKDKD